MTSSTANNPTYETYPWTISPNGTLYVLTKPLDRAPPSLTRLGRVLGCSHKSKWFFTASQPGPALILKVEKAPEDQSSSSQALQSPTQPIQVCYVVGEYNYSPFTPYLPDFKYHEGVYAAFTKFSKKPREWKQGKWLKEVLKKELARHVPDPSLSNPRPTDSTRKTLDQEFTQATTRPGVFTSSVAEETDQPSSPPTAADRARIERLVAQQTSSQPGFCASLILLPICTNDTWTKTPLYFFFCKQKSMSC